VRHHGGQAQGGAQVDAVEGHLVDSVFHRAKASFGVSPRAFTLSASFFISAFS
jgi:hypothetical protein